MGFFSNIFSSNDTSNAARNERTSNDHKTAWMTNKQTYGKWLSAADYEAKTGRRGILDSNSLAEKLASLDD